MRTTETRFSTGITRCERRRSWARPAVLVLLAAVVIWLMSGCTPGAGGGLGEWEDLPRWLRGALVGLGGFFIIALTWAAALKVKREDDAALADWWDEEENEAVSAGGGRVRATNIPPPPVAWKGIDPLGLPFAGIDVASMGRITEALLKQTEGAAMWVESARKTLCRHEQDDMLRMALRDLQPVNACLPELKKMLAKQEGRAVL